MELLPDNTPWYVVGPAIGLLVVGLYAVANKPLGVSGAYLQVAMFARGRGAEVWRVWYFLGILAGAGLSALLRGGPTLSTEYGALGRLVPLPALVPVLVVAGVLMGYGARWAGGCTSGHGLCGTSTRSAASFVTTITFMVTAIAVTFILQFITGGAL